MAGYRNQHVKQKNSCIEQADSSHVQEIRGAADC